MNKIKSWKSSSIKESQIIAEELSKLFKTGDVILMEGDLGSGKTLFVQNICSKWNIQDDVTSPTFTIIQNYSGDYNVNHIDLYRIEDNNELDQLGWEDMLYSGAVTFVEWPQKIEKFLRSFYKLSILVNNDTRIIELYKK